MSKYVQRKFAQKSSFYRYLYFLVSGLRFRSFAAWKQEGEPNPFVRPCYDARITSRSELVSLFRSRLTSHVSA